METEAPCYGWRMTSGAAPDAVQAARPVLNGGCDMKSSQSLLCTTCGHDTTRCPLSGILRRGAGRQRLVPRLRTMNPQSCDWNRHREGTMSLSAPRRRVASMDVRATPGERLRTIVTENTPKVREGLSQNGTVAGTRTPPFLVMGRHAPGGQRAPHPCVCNGDGTWEPRTSPARASGPQGQPRGVREREEGRSERHPVMGWRGGEPTRTIPPHASEQTSIWSCLTRDLGQPREARKPRTAVAPRTGARSDRPVAWQPIQWDAVHRHVRRLQARLGQAVPATRGGQVPAVPPLLPHACSGKALAVQRGTTTNGRRTPGSDGLVWDPPAQHARAGGPQAAGLARPAAATS